MRFPRKADKFIFLIIFALNLILMEQVLDFLDHIDPLEPGLRDFLKRKLRRSIIQKDAILLKEGMIANTISFIEKGLVRGFRSLENDIERTIWFMMEGDVFISVRSFLRQIPANETVQTIEPCITYSLTFQEYKEALGKYRSFNLHRAELLQKYYLLSEERNEMRQQKDKFAQLCFLMENFPHLNGRVPDKHLASFINVRPSYFSELKDKYIEQKKNKR